MKRHVEKQTSESRRSFLKTAAAGALIAAGPTVNARSDRETNRHASGSERAEALLQRYGGEFGELGRGGA